jgi:hypothetical protein
MKVARARSMLWSGAAVAAGGAVVAALAAVALPLDAPVRPPDSAPGPGEAAGSPAAPELPPLASFEPAWKAPLRRPLVDPPPALAAEPARPPPPLIRLIGTIIDSDRPRGVFLVGLTGMELRGVGEKAGAAEVLRIDAESATVRLNGEEFILKRDKDPFNPNAIFNAPTAARAGPAPGS